MKIIAYTTLNRDRLILAAKRDKTTSCAVANRYSVPLAELNEARATVERLAKACERLQKGHPHLAGVYGVTAALAAYRGDA